MKNSVPQSYTSHKVLNSHMWLIDITLDSKYIESFIGQCCLECRIVRSNIAATSHM